MRSPALPQRSKRLPRSTIPSPFSICRQSVCALGWVVVMSWNRTPSIVRSVGTISGLER